MDRSIGYVQKAMEIETHSLHWQGTQLEHTYKLYTDWQLNALIPYTMRCQTRHTWTDNVQIVVWPVTEPLPDNDRRENSLSTKCIADNDRSHCLLYADCKKESRSHIPEHHTIIVFTWQKPELPMSLYGIMWLSSSNQAITLIVYEDLRLTLWDLWMNNFGYSLKYRASLFLPTYSDYPISILFYHWGPFYELSKKLTFKSHWQ